jgi:hypothetical protein
VPVVPHDGALGFEALVELRVRDLRERYEQEVIPYACKAKDIWDMSQAESIEDVAEQVVLSVGGNVTLVPSVVRLVHEMETKSATDRVGEVAVFTLCQAVGDRFRTSPMPPACIKIAVVGICPIEGDQHGDFHRAG